MKILLTGASGFIGRSFMARFNHRTDTELWGIGRRPMNWHNYSQIDLSKPFQLEFKPDTVIHAAALSSPWGSKQQFNRNNVQATQNVIDFCQANDLPKLVYISSSSVFYKYEHQFNMTEECAIGPEFVNLYAQTKYRGEELVQKYPGEKVILRPRAVFGPGDTVLFPRILHAAKCGRMPLLIQDGPEVIGDLIYIDVLLDYMLEAACNSRISGAYNLTNGEPVPIQKFLLSVFDDLGLPMPHRKIKVSSAMRFAMITEFLYRLFQIPWEPPITKFGVGVFAYSKTFDASRAISELGPPAISVEEGRQLFVEWQKKQWQQ